MWGKRILSLSYKWRWSSSNKKICIKIKQTIKDQDFYIKKKFGQNFLVDQNILRNIVATPTITENTLVIEIGPGMGSLTEHLIEKSKHVLAYEIDKELLPILDKNFKGEPLTVINDDFLNRNIDQDIEDLNMEFDRVCVVANLPYYITTPIILKILEESNKVKEMVLMMQLEVARRLTSKPSTKDYNSLSIVIQYKTKAEIALKVPRTVFIPAPNVDSAVVKLVVEENLFEKPDNEEHFFKLVRASFTQRRKTLVNNLHFNFQKEKEYYINVLEDLGYDSRIRAENLAVEDFIIISNTLSR